MSKFIKVKTFDKKNVQINTNTIKYFYEDNFIDSNTTVLYLENYEHNTLQVKTSIEEILNQWNEVVKIKTVDDNYIYISKLFIKMFLEYNHKDIPTLKTTIYLKCHENNIIGVKTTVEEILAQLKEN